MNSTVILSTAYFAPIQYYAKLVIHQKVYIEYCENYLKQSYRNRAVILAANGPLPLTIPIINGPSAKGPIKEQQLSFDYNWQQMQWRSLVSAYNNSPFFEYYADDLAPFFESRKWHFLLDFNDEIQAVILKLLNIKTEIEYTQTFTTQENIPSDINDFRYLIHPKLSKQNPDESFTPIPYHQVFNEKWGFVPNLSILDLLFNEGPATTTLLKSCNR
jgi:WbqC-like protein family